jgi:hypothetical protein
MASDEIAIVGSCHPLCIRFSILSLVSDFISVALSLSVPLPVPVSTLRASRSGDHGRRAGIIRRLDGRATIRGGSRAIIQEGEG